MAKTIIVRDSADLMPDRQVALRYNVAPRTLLASYVGALSHTEPNHLLSLGGKWFGRGREHTCNTEPSRGAEHKESGEEDDSKK
jgi:hypothetical protein